MNDYNFWAIGSNLWVHKNCKQVFSAPDLNDARRHHYSCPALHDTVNPGPLA